MATKRRIDRTQVPVARLSAARRRELFEDLNYLNMGEIKAFCKRHKIPFVIYIQTKDGPVRTGELDRKAIVLDRIRTFLSTGKVLPPTIFPMHVVAQTKNAAPKKSDKILYGVYRNRSPAVLKLLKSLTEGKFKFGAVAQELTRSFWTQGKAPTFEEFAERWTQIAEDPTWNHPEAAYITELKAGTERNDWKRIRAQKAKSVLDILSKVPG